jgi:hypothetical protein
MGAVKRCIARQESVQYNDQYSFESGSNLHFDPLKEQMWTSSTDMEKLDDSDHPCLTQSLSLVSHYQMCPTQLTYPQATDMSMVAAAPLQMWETVQLPTQQGLMMPITLATSNDQQSDAATHHHQQQHWQQLSSAMAACQLTDLGPHNFPDSVPQFVPTSVQLDSAGNPMIDSSGAVMWE